MPTLETPAPPGETAPPVGHAGWEIADLLAQRLAAPRDPAADAAALNVYRGAREMARRPA